ncbi:MAG: tRNA (adenosine(37)-N6)-threonylcarbamoyltransferase complex dimerization subunit type 1 TsaB [Rhodospirillaceae bacterium]|nr:tRNA (adenosine(37)-N6)-threonylcarbamoyltransferase complex dimerization subunit type 1 TsaB [Rhodospirillaceae bacterium]
MLILAFDCSLQNCSVAILSSCLDDKSSDSDVLLVERSYKTLQLETLIPMVIGVILKDSGLTWSDIDLIGVTVGPGTFTGIRIGLAAARGIALATKIPVVGISTCEAIANGVPQKERLNRTLLVAIDSKRVNKILVQVFTSDLIPLGQPSEMESTKISENFYEGSPLLLAGNATEQLLLTAPSNTFIATMSTFPSARIIANMAINRHKYVSTIFPPEPIYIQLPNVTLHRKK